MQANVLVCVCVCVCVCVFRRGVGATVMKIATLSAATEWTLALSFTKEKDASYPTDVTLRVSFVEDEVPPRQCLWLWLWLCLCLFVCVCLSLCLCASLSLSLSLSV